MTDEPKITDGPRRIIAVCHPRLSTKASPSMTDKVVISVDGACSGRRCACAARMTRNGRVVAESSRSLPEVDGYVLAAEITAVALAVGLVADEDEAAIVTDAELFAPWQSAPSSTDSPDSLATSMPCIVDRARR